jgi:F-type H+-transporting ATPase subunit delta
MADNTEAASIAAGFLRYLDSNGKRALLPQVVAALQKQLGPQLPELVVESAIAMSDSDKREVLATLNGREHSGDVQFKVNPELIGGMKVTHGDRVLDMSVQGKLKKIYA